jgi:hypothetical protein
VLTTASPRLSYSRSKAADLRRLHRSKKVSVISDEMRAVVESERPVLAHKLPPTKPQSDHFKMKTLDAPAEQRRMGQKEMGITAHDRRPFHSPS